MKKRWFVAAIYFRKLESPNEKNRRRFGGVKGNENNNNVDPKSCRVPELNVTFSLSTEWAFFYEGNNSQVERGRFSVFAGASQLYSRLERERGGMRERESIREEREEK